MYLTLWKKVRDVLAKLVSTVALESTFSTGGRVLDSLRTSSSPIMVKNADFEKTYASMFRPRVRRENELPGYMSWGFYHRIQSSSTILARASKNNEIGKLSGGRHRQRAWKSV
ncbi:hypothetical protein LXL04_022580 [Taraxacum kok-saghyz]